MTKENAKLAKQYQSMTALEHISKKPDTYIGAVEQDITTTWTYDSENKKIIHKSFNWVPGFYKCFDEALVNARDHQVRMHLSKEKNKNLVKKTFGSLLPIDIEDKNDNPLSRCLFKST